MSVLNRLAHRLLFVGSPISPEAHVEGTDRQHVVTALIKGRPGVRAQALERMLLDAVAPALAQRRVEWRIASVTLQRAVPLSRPIVFFFELTRTRRMAAWLCDLAREPEPPPFHLSLCPQYDAVVEVRFMQTPDADALDGLRRLVNDSALIEPAILVGSEFQVRVYDNGATSDIDKRVNICFLLRRPPGVTREACQAYWRDQHARLALSNMRYLRLTRYRQVHTTLTPLPGLDDTYDGVVYAEKSSFRQLARDLLQPNTARFNSTIVVDECHFTDATPVTLMQCVGGWD